MERMAALLLDSLGATTSAAAKLFLAAEVEGGGGA